MKYSLMSTKFTICNFQIFTFPARIFNFFMFAFWCRISLTLAVVRMLAFPALVFPFIILRKFSAFAFSIFDGNRYHSYTLLNRKFPKKQKHTVKCVHHNQIGGGGGHLVPVQHLELLILELFDGF